MKSIRRYAALLALTAVAMLGPAAAASHACNSTNTSTTPPPAVETEDDTAWGSPPADEPAPEPTEDATDANAARDTAWG